MHFFDSFLRPKGNGDWKRNGTVFDERMRIYWYMSPRDDGVFSPCAGQTGYNTVPQSFQKPPIKYGVFVKNLRTGERFWNDAFSEKKKIRFCYKNEFMWAEFPRITNIKFLLTIYIHHKEKKLWELTKCSLKGKCFDLWANSLSW